MNAAGQSRIQPQSRVLISSRVYARPFGDEIVLLDFVGGDYFGLDEVGAEVWRNLEKGTSLEEITNLIAERYDEDRSVILRDVVQLVSALLERELVALVDDAG